MKLPLKWLKEYVDYNVTHEEFIERLMWRGFEVASAEPELPGVSGVVTGRILSCKQHPNADKLHVCEVDAGTGEVLQIVCGAPNAREGITVPVALPGANLPGGIVIKPAEMRGIESRGMLCSGKELGITEADHPGAEANGLLILEDGCKTGISIQKALDMDSVVFDIEITPNRADCQSIIGMCREAAAALGQKFKEPAIRKVEGTGDVSDAASVTVMDTEKCPRYCARVVKDIVIAPSPAWMQKKLRSVGLRPINNIVDITNLVLVEYGHPMHAFDLACVEEGHIVVRTAYEGEKVTTLDSKVRDVTTDMLLIADPKKGVGIAGVMGGENSEITESTKAVLFESAVFKGSSIRNTSRKLKLMTDAAARFMKGVEPVNAMKALERAIELVDELKAGTVLKGTLDACSADLSDRMIEIDCGRVNRIIDSGFTPRQMADLLSAINIPAEPKGENLIISVPHYRTDIESGIEKEADIAEEIARLYGYYNIKAKLMRSDTFSGRISDEFQDEDAVKDALVCMGAYEMYNYNFIGPSDLDSLLLPDGHEKRRAVRIVNPFGEDQSLMRTSLIPGMLKSLKTNINRKTGHGRFFEVGNVHLDLEGQLPDERKMIGIALMGDGEDFYTLKGCIEQLLETFRLTDCKFAAGGGEYLHSGRKAMVFADGECIGELGEIHPVTASSYDIPARVYVAELDFYRLTAHKRSHARYASLPKYPVVPRDIAVVVDNGVTAGELKEAIESVSAEVLIENAELFDVYRGSNIPENKKSMAYSFTLRCLDRTLTDEDITSAMNAVVRTLKEKFGALLRG
ncbi:MAG: Phenylalanine--tRNA ligase beta subunit [Firmicutes bacterium ADurb.Bin182]|nr:MAG: Phenylalanine--tRNA ligase beta subunit [Firmicutes bacterium ADurb.Bin182]